MTRTYLTIAFSILSCLFFSAASSQAQTQISLRLQAKAVNSSGNLVWRTNLQLAPTDITIDETTLAAALKTSCPSIAEPLRKRILEELARIGADQKILAPDRALDELKDSLQRAASGDTPLNFSSMPPAGFAAPTRAGETLAEHGWSNWTVSFDPLALAVVDYALAIQTKRAGTNSVSVDVKMSDIAGDLHVKSLLPGEGAVKVTLTYAPEDLQKPDGSTRPAAEIVLALERAAYESFLILREQGVQRCEFRDANVDREIQKQTEILFDAYVPDVSANSFLDAAGVETFGVTGIELIEEINITVLPEPDSQGKQTPTAGDKRIEQLVNSKYKPRLLAQPGSIVTKDILDKDTQRLYQVRSVSEVPKGSVSGGVLTYTVIRRRQIANLSLTGAGSYDPEHALDGTAAATGENLFGWKESMSVALKGGNSFQKGQFNFSIPPEIPKVRRKIPITFAGFGFNASYSYDSVERLGNPVVTSFSNRESQISTKLSFAYDSFTKHDYVEQADAISEDRHRLHHLVTADLGFDLQNTHLKSRGLVPLAAPDGRIVFPSLRLNYVANYDLRKAGKRSGLGEVDFVFTATGQKGFRGLGGDFSYRQFELSSGAQIFFGFTSTTDLFLRYQRGAGASSNGTPLFKIFRLGGPQNVRGLEEGEFVANSYAYDRTEFGVALLPVFRRLFPPKKSGDDSDTETPSPTLGGIDLANTYLKVFYDRGRVFETKALGEILNPAHGIKGYGIAAELRGLAVIANKRANLTIGYARSPDSLLHRHGVIVTGLSLDF